MKRPKTVEEYRYICEEYNWKCENCGTRHPTKVTKCFKCGKSNMVVYNKVTNKQKRKSKIRGNTIKIGL